MSHNIVYLNWTFTPDKIRSGNLYLAASLLSSSLEVNTLTAEVACADPAILDFARNTPLRFLPPSGRPMIFRVQSVTRTGPEVYEISATSTLGLLTEGLHYGGIYTGQTAGAVIADICGPVPCAVKHNLEGIKLYGWLPIAAPRDNLAQVLFAIGAALRTDLDGVLRIQSLWDGISGQVDRDLMYMDAAADYAAKVTQVIVTEHQYVPWTEEQQLFEGTAQQGDIITFGEPMHALTASGFTILASGANWARLSAGSGVLIGKTYLHNTRQVSRDVWPAQDPNVRTVQDATLVSLVNSQAAAERLAHYYRCREVVDAPVVYLGEQPGDRLAVWHPFDKIAVDACLESADINLSNTLKAQERSLVGFVPEQIEQIVTFDNRVLLTSSGTWTVPEGVSQVRVVLIGGGQNGGAGTDGGGCYVTSRTWSGGSFSTPSGSPGNGGSGGGGGSGGKVLEFLLDVTPGQAISYAAGAAGQDSVFGTRTSASGGLMPSGWTDTVTGEVFAKPGTAGTAGGKGGSPGSRGTAVNGNGGGPPNSTINPTSGSWKTYLTASWGGSGGGGASATDTGKIGAYAYISATISTSNGVSNANVTVEQRGNGAGAAGGAGANASVYGGGGNGGHGGGGAGGFASVSVSPKSGTTITRGNFAGTWISGGTGGAGGSGKQGCIILFYGVVRKVPSGQLVDRTNKMLLDRLGRRIVV